MRPLLPLSSPSELDRHTPLPDSLDQLYTDFDRLPSAVIKQSFASAPHACFFAPTWTTLRRKLTAGEYDNQKLKKARKPPKPVVRIVRRERDGLEWDEEEVEGPPPELKREMGWLLDKISASSRPSLPPLAPFCSRAPYRTVQ